MLNLNSESVGETSYPETAVSESFKSQYLRYFHEYVTEIQKSTPAYLGCR